eukprot:16407302-Heterocapsa_arctica.AAC.1
MEDREHKRLNASLDKESNKEGVEEAKDQLNPRQDTRVQEAVGKIEGNIVRNQAWAKAAEQFMACRKRIRDKEDIS